MSNLEQLKKAIIQLAHDFERANWAGAQERVKSILNEPEELDKLTHPMYIVGAEKVPEGDFKPDVKTTINNNELEEIDGHKVFGISECCNAPLFACECPVKRTDYRYCSKCYKHLGEIINEPEENDPYFCYDTTHKWVYKDTLKCHTCDKPIKTRAEQDNEPEWKECSECGGMSKDLTNTELGQELKKAIEEPTLEEKLEAIEKWVEECEFNKFNLDKKTYNIQNKIDELYNSIITHNVEYPLTWSNK